MSLSNLQKKKKSVLDHADKTLLPFSDTGSGVPLFSCTTVTSIPVGIASTSISLVFLIDNEIVKMFLKTMVRKKINKEELFDQYQK